jgi:TPR repeat protein
LSFLATKGDKDIATELYRRVTQGDEAGLRELIERAEKRKDWYASFFVGLSFDPNSHNRGVKPDAVKAAMLYRSAIELPAARHNLALLLLSGVSYEPKPKDGEPAQQFDPIQLLELAATKRVESMLLLGVLFERGFGSVKPNAALSAQWYSKAIEHSKDRRALTRLGISYLEGRGVPQDAAKGQELLLSAAKAGSSEAQYRLALLDQRDVQAAQWLSVAAMTDPAYGAAAQAALLDAQVAAKRDLAERERAAEGAVTGALLQRDAAAAQALRDQSADILAANAIDVTAGTTAGLSPAMLDRLKLNEARVAAMAAAVEQAGAAEGGDTGFADA